MAWKINDTELRARWEELNGPFPTGRDFQLVRALSVRLAREDEDGSSISPYEILREVQRAKDNPRHFLNIPPRQLTATTLVVLLSLSSKRPVQHDSKLIQKVSQSDETWNDFLGNFYADHVTRPDRMLIGAWEMAAKTEQYGVLGVETLLGGASFLVNAGDSVDVRIHVLAGKAVALADGIHKELDTSKKLSEINDAISRMQQVLSEIKNDDSLVTRMKSNPKIFADLHLLLEFIALHGRKRLSLEALEALVALHTDIYENRAEHPVGRVTASFPNVDGTNREQVMDFLKTLGIIPINEPQADRAWQFWQSTWNQKEIHAGDIGWDMDRTLYQYKLHLLSGKEYLRMDPVLIRLVALALRDKRPNIVVSNAIRARIADFANHPELAAFRFAFFLRMPRDPYVTVEEIASMPNVSSYEELMDERIYSMNHMSNDPVEVLRQASRLLTKSRQPDGEFDPDLVAGAMSLIQSLMRGESWEGVKLTTGLKRHQKEVPLFLVDDNKNHVRDFVKSGGAGGVVVPRLERHTEGLYVDQHKIYDPFKMLVALVQVAKRRADLKDTIVPIDKETDAIGTRDDFPPMDARFQHNKWGYKVWEGWVRAGRVMLFSKIKLMARLILAGKFRQAQREAHSLFGTDLLHLAARQLTEEVLQPVPPTDPAHADPNVPVADLIRAAVAEGGESSSSVSVEPDPDAETEPVIRTDGPPQTHEGGEPTDTGTTKGPPVTEDFDDSPHLMRGGVILGDSATVYPTDGSAALQMQVGVVRLVADPVKQSRPHLRLVSGTDDTGVEEDGEEGRSSHKRSAKNSLSRRPGIHAGTQGRVLQFAPRSPVLLRGR